MLKSKSSQAHSENKRISTMKQDIVFCFVKHQVQFLTHTVEDGALCKKAAHHQLPMTTIQRTFAKDPVHN